MADGLLDVELIEFVCPYRNEVNLYVTNIAKSLNKEEVEVGIYSWQATVLIIVDNQIL